METPQTPTVHSQDIIPWDDKCPLYQMFSILWKKWTIYIIFLIWDNINTFSFIMKKLSKINSKVLSDRLDDLIENKLIIREVTTSKPLKITYKLSESGQKIFNQLRLTWDWVLKDFYNSENT